MRFTTLSFFLFFAFVYIGFWTLKGKPRLAFTLVASIIFYAAWSPLFALHFLTIVLLNYALIVMQFKNIRGAFASSIVLNALNLFFFKYFYLFLLFLYDVSGNHFFDRQLFNGWLESVTGQSSITLPLAISFYTFQLVAYQFDVKRKQINHRPGLLKFAIFILFFPQLVAGPIMRHSEFYHQLDNITPDRQRMIDGLYLLILGLLKKVMVADTLTSITQEIFLNPLGFDRVSNVAGIIGFAARVYCDFSGYTDIARGLSKLLGLELPENFRGPYLSRSLRELWQRWHVTLSTWLRDYIYIPLGGSRGGSMRTHLNTIITFTLGGLWHGANYTYIIWGFLHGVGLMVERLVSDFYRKVIANRQPDPSHANAANEGQVRSARLARIRSGLISTAGVLYTFGFFSIGIIFFNAPDITHAWQMIATLIGIGPGGSSRTPHVEFISYMTVLTLDSTICNTADPSRFTPKNGAWRYSLHLALL